MKIRRSTFILSAMLGVCAWLVFGCTDSQLQLPNGGKYSNTSFLWSRDATEVNIKSNGDLSVTILGSKSDADGIKAAAAGAAEGAVKGISGKP